MELTYWHMINLKSLELGLWSQYKFKDRKEHHEFEDLLLITALKAKKLANTEEDFWVY